MAISKKPEDLTINELGSLVELGARRFLITELQKVEHTVKEMVDKKIYQLLKAALGIKGDTWDSVELRDDSVLGTHIKEYAKQMVKDRMKSFMASATLTQMTSTKRLEKEYKKAFDNTVEEMFRDMLYDEAEKDARRTVKALFSRKPKNGSTDKEPERKPGSLHKLRAFSKPARRSAVSVPADTIQGQQGVTVAPDGADTTNDPATEIQV